MTRGLWSRETVALLTLAALLPLAVFWFWLDGAEAFFRVTFVLLVIAIWHLFFMLYRAQPPSISALVTALAIAMLAPAELGVFQMMLGISFGVVMGELVFGGWGRNVVNPATVTLAFLGFGFPSAPWPVFEAPLVWAAIPAGLLGLALGVMPTALLVVIVVAGSLASAIGAVSAPIVHAALIVVVLLVADPVTSAATTLGRVLHGALFAALVVLFDAAWLGAAPLQIAIAATFLASLAAPLLDDIALFLWVQRRRRLHGRT